MDKSNFKKFALMGMAGGMLVASQSPVLADSANVVSETVIAASCGSACGAQRNQSCGAPSNPNGPRYSNPTAFNDMDESSPHSGQQNGKTMSEDELMSQLNSDGKATYQSLSTEGKALALKLANQDCKGKNSCKGLGSCKSAANSCAGKNGCAGTSPGPFKDKNTAVKVAAQKMAEKRNSVTSGSSY